MDLFQWLTDTTEGKCLFTTLVSMIPIIELRGGIPFGVALGMPYWLAFPAAVIGNVIPAPLHYRVHPPHLRLDAQTSAPPEQHGGQAGGEGPPEGTEGAGATSIWAFGSLWQFPCPEPAHGPALWWPPF